MKADLILVESYFKKLQERGCLLAVADLQDNFVLAQFQVAEALKILNETPVIADRTRESSNLKHLHYLSRNRSVSESDNNSTTLQVPVTHCKGKSSSTGDLLSEPEPKMANYELVSYGNCDTMYPRISWKIRRIETVSSPSRLLREKHPSEHRP